MIRDAAVSLIASRVGQRTDLNAAIILEMDLVIRTKLEESARMTPWFLRHTDSTLVTIVDEETVALPDDFIIEEEDWPLQAYDAEALQWRKLDKLDYNTLADRYVEAQSDFPEGYAIDGLNLIIRPLSDEAYPLRLRYFRKDPQSVATSNVENLWLKYAPDLVIAATCAEVARGQIHNYELAASFAPEIVGAWDRLKTLNEARKHVNMDYQMGDD